MRDWPPIAEPELLDRLALDNGHFTAFFQDVIAAWPRREFDPEAFEHALGYPFERPPGSYILRGEDVEMLKDVDGVKRESVIAAFTENRYPIVSFGANAAPDRLSMKFGHFDDEADREVLVLAGDLHELDIGAVASPPLLGYMPATLFASPGTAVRAAVIWVGDRLAQRSAALVALDSLSGLGRALAIACLTTIEEIAQRLRGGASPSSRTGRQLPATLDQRRSTTSYCRPSANPTISGSPVQSGASSRRAVATQNASAYDKPPRALTLAADRTKAQSALITLLRLRIFSMSATASPSPRSRIRM